MTVQSKRFSISITPAMEDDLMAAKLRYFYNKKESEMLRDLIIMGLNAQNSEQVTPEEECEKSIC